MKVTKYLAVALLGAFVLFAGCSDSNDIIARIEPADISGEWELTITNPDQALYTNCTQDLLVRQGLTWATVDAASGVTCTTTDPIVITQLVTAFDIEPTSFSCSDGSTRIFSGLGTVVDNSIFGQWTTVSDAGWTTTELFTGQTAAPLTLTLDVDQIGSVGTIDGFCSYNPRLNYSVSITRSSASAGDL